MPYIYWPQKDYHKKNIILCPEIFFSSSGKPAAKNSIVTKIKALPKHKYPGNYSKPVLNTLQTNLKNSKAENKKRTAISKRYDDPEKQIMQ